MTWTDTLPLTLVGTNLDHQTTVTVTAEVTVVVTAVVTVELLYEDIPKTPH